MKYLKIQNGKVSAINFKCQQCGRCCSLKNEEMITLTFDDISKISEFLKITSEEFIINYCDWINDDFLSLKSINDKCIFFDVVKKICTINKVKPKQCATFPYWEIIVEKPYDLEMKRYQKFCKGFGKAAKYKNITELWNPINIIRKLMI